MGESVKNCNHCGLRLPDDAFNWRYRLLGIRHKTCRNCQNEYQRSWYQKHRDLHLIKVQTRKANVRLEARQFVLEYLSTYACTECGESDPMVLEFHHLQGKDREISVMIAGGSLRDRSWRTAYLMYPDL